MRPGDLELTAQALDYCAFAAGAILVDAGCGTGVTFALNIAVWFRHERLLICSPHPIYFRRRGSGPKEFHIQPLTYPYLNLSIYTALTAIH